MKSKSAVLFLACLISPLLDSARAAEPELASAVRDGHRTAAIALLRKGAADVNTKLADGTSALLWAVRSDDLELVSRLPGAKANVNDGDPNGITPLALACANANVAIAGKLVAAGANADLADVSGVTPLMTAVGRPRIENVRLLLDAHAKVDARDNRAQETALMIAVRDNNSSAVRELLDHGADVNAATRTGKTPARRRPGAGGGSHGAGIVRSGWPESGYQDATPGGLTPLLYAARDGHTEIARMLIAAGAKVNLADANKISPLLMAITNNQPDAADLLIEKGAEINTADFWGRTPLWAAVEMRNVEYSRSGEHNVDRAAATVISAGLPKSGGATSASLLTTPGF